MSNVRIDFHQGSYYHVMNRTSSGIMLFRDHYDYLAFNRRLNHYAKEANIEIITKSFMPTHYHLLIRQDGEKTASFFLHKLSISYTALFKKRYKHHGSIFGQRFRSVEIMNIQQFRNTCCYIHANAFKDRLVNKPIEWPYGDLSLFTSQKFWDEQTDKYLLESFGSLEGFLDAFNFYLEVIKEFRGPNIISTPITQ